MFVVSRNDPVTDCHHTSRKYTSVENVNETFCWKILRFHLHPLTRDFSSPVFDKPVCAVYMWDAGVLMVHLFGELVTSSCECAALDLFCFASPSCLPSSVWGLRIVIVPFLPPSKTGRVWNTQQPPNVDLRCGHGTFNKHNKHMWWALNLSIMAPQLILPKDWPYLGPHSPW